MSTSDELHPEASARRDAGKLAGQVEANDTKWLMSSKQGRRIVRRWLAAAGIHRTSFTGNSETFFREGKRALGLEIEAEVIRHAGPDYILMLTEGMA
jgi:hypothetical protein